VISVDSTPLPKILWVSPLQGGSDLAEWSFADPDDMIYVRAPTRVGKAHQAVIPAFGEPSFGQSSQRDSPHFAVTDDAFTRGDDDTIELLSNVVHMPEELGEPFPLDQDSPLIIPSFSHKGQVAYHYSETMPNFFS
jgi:hypothetical protein